MAFKKIARRIGKILVWILGIWIGLLLLIQIVLLPPIFTGISNSLANKFTNADVHIGMAYGSVFRHFPRISFTFEDLEITYPHERYDSLARAGAQHELLYAGCGESSDTLAIINELSASVSLASLLFGEIKLPDIEIDSPTIYAHSYDGRHANWNIFGEWDVKEQTDTTSVEDSTESSGGSSDEGWNIILKKIKVTGNPELVYTDSQDSIFVRVNLENAGFDGHFESNSLHKLMAKAFVNNLNVNGNYKADTLSGGIHKIDITPRNTCMHLEANGQIKAYSTIEELTSLPVTFSGDISIPKDEGIAISLNNMQTSVGMIPAQGAIDVKMRSDSTVVKGNLKIDEYNIQNLLSAYLSTCAPSYTDIYTDTQITIDANIDGSINNLTGSLPVIDVTVNIPDSELSHSTFPDKINMGMDAKINIDKHGGIHADLTKAIIKTYGLDFNSTAGTNPLENNDRQIEIDGHLIASLDSLKAFLPDSLGIITKGGFNTTLNGSIKMSELGIYQFAKSNLQGCLKSDDFIIKMPKDQIDINIAGVQINLTPRSNPADTLPTLTSEIKSTNVKYQDSFELTGKDFYFAAKNQNVGKGKTSPTLQGNVNAGSFYIKDSEGTSIVLEKTNNVFTMTPSKDNSKKNVLGLTNSNLRITYATPDNRIILTNSKFNAEAALMKLNKDKKKIQEGLDELQKKYPDIPRDSLFAHHRKVRKANEQPVDDFTETDKKLNINRSARRYFRSLELSGNGEIEKGIIMTNYFPIRNILRGTKFSFTNDQASIDNLTLIAGDSKVCIDSSNISNIREAILRNKELRLKLNISSSSVNGDQLMKAFLEGSQYESPTDKKATEELTNAQFFKQVTSDTLKVADTDGLSELVVLPRNLDANINIDMSKIRFKTLDISEFATNIAIKERCAQIKGSVLKSNMGDASLDAFYATRSKTDIKSGFCLDLKDVTSESVISLIPQIDTVIPMLNSITGKLNCEIAATAELDTTMSIKRSTINGIARMSGTNLTISDDEVYTAVAKKLFFKNKKSGNIKDLMIEGIIKDERLEVFPFLLKLDRYTIGVSGVQNMDMSYKHHISVLRSPFLIRMGLNFSGTDYDHMKFKLGKAKYRKKDMPSFSDVVDSTKIVLKNNIDSIFVAGVDSTIAKTNTHQLVEKHKEEIKYINPAETDLEELSPEDMAEFKKIEEEDQLLEDAIEAIVEAVQAVLNTNTQTYEQSGVYRGVNQDHPI